MTEYCLETDALVSVAAALDWDLPGRLDHLAACEPCRARLTELAELQRELAAAPSVAELDPAAATARAMAGLATLPSAAGEAMQAPARPNAALPRGRTPLVAAATFLTAGATTLLVITLLAGELSAPPALAAAALAGLAAIAPARPFRRQKA